MELQGVYAKSTHFCIIDISVFIEIKYGYEWHYLFKILPAFRIYAYGYPKKKFKKSVGSAKSSDVASFNDGDFL